MATQAVTPKATHVVTISIESGVFHYKNKNGEDARKLHVKHGDSIAWRCHHGHFHAVFSDGTPLDHFAFAGKKGLACDPGVIQNVHARGKSFKYSVSVSDDDLSKPPLVDDPEIVID